MQLTEGHRRLGALIREKRLRRGWTLDNVSAKARSLGIKLSPQFLSQIENAYEHPTKGVVTPSDEKLLAISKALDIPLVDLHAALGRIPTDEGQTIPLSTGEIVVIHSPHRISDRVKEAIKDYAEYQMRKVVEEEAKETNQT
jgi:transcriptional regulator with XRE-family HTH domain